MDQKINQIINKFLLFCSKKTILFVFCFLPLELEAAESEKKISLKEVVDSAAKFYPQILSSYEKVNAAEGSYLASQGFFDVKLNQEIYNKTRGFYDSQTYDTSVEKELGFMGSKIYGGYRKSLGSFPIYEGNKVTRSDGEYRIGGKVSLLKDRGIDSNRLSVLLSKLGIEESKIQLDLIIRTIQRDAVKYYWKWVVSGKVYQIYKDLYEFSLDRQKQLEERMRKGDVAKIIVEENKKNILRRKNALIEAKQEFDNNAISLSLYFRNENGLPITVLEQDLPIIEDRILYHKFDQQKDLIQAFERRPEIKIIKIKQNENELQSKYSKNLLQPKLDVEFEASKDQGTGTIAQSQSENVFGIKFSTPLQFREARGKIAEYDAKLRAISFEKQLLKEQISNEISSIVVNINSLAEIHENLMQEVKLAEVLEKSERERFLHGASNFFLVNMREQDTAMTKANKAKVLEKYYATIADYELAIFNSDKNL